MSNKHKIIGITGAAGCGKDTAADYLIDRLPGLATKTSFADPIKRMAQTGLNLSNGQVWGDKKDFIDGRYGCTPRHILQTLGTEWGRQTIGQNIWIEAMAAHIGLEALLTCSLIIPDVRFENEADLIRSYDCGRIIHVSGRDGMIDSDHVSESGIQVDKRDIVVQNKDNMEAFHDYLNEAMKCL